MVNRKAIRQVLATVAMVSMVVSCGKDGTAPAVATTLALASGNDQTATVGQPLSQTLTVRVTDNLGRGVEAVTVSWQVVTGGGALSATSNATSAQGEASVTWTLGTTAGSRNNSLTASVNGLSGSPVIFTATATAGPFSASQSTATATPTAISAGSGASTVVVTARDAFGNPINGATVVLAATGTGNTLTQPVGTTNASGAATGTLSSTVAEVKTVSATINTVAITQTATVTVKTAGVSAAQSTVTATSPIVASSGTSQSGITVTAKDQFGNLIPGATVVLAATGTGNTVTQPAGATDASGVANGALSSTVAEGKILSAAINGVGAAQTATVIVTAAAPAHIVKSAGDNQMAAVNGGVAIPPTVRVTDQFGNPVSGLSVTWAVSSGGGSLSSTSAVTNGQGESSVTWTLGSAGTNTVTATATDIPPVTFTATGVTDVGGIVNANTTWSLVNSPYRITSDVQVAYGVMLTIEPGVLVYGQGRAIQVWGTLSAVGTSGSRVVFNSTLVKPGISNSAAQPYVIHVSHAELNGGSIYAPTGFAVYGSLTLTDSFLNGLADYMYLWYPVADCYIERNVFKISGGISTGTSGGVTIYVRNNLFQSQTTTYAVENWASYNSSQTIVELNTFWSTDRIAVRLPVGSADGRLSATNNYWNTTDESVIQSMIFDKNDDLGSAGYIAYVPFLTAPDPSTPIP